jgi:hypothetical protein
MTQQKADGAWDMTVKSETSPWLWFVPFLLCELWLLLQIPEFILSDSRAAGSFVAMMARVLPVIHQLDRIASKPEVLHFFLAISPVLLIPKMIFWTQWLASDKLRILRYFVVSPLTRRVPKRALDFVTDPLRSNKENDDPATTVPVNVGRRILISAATLVFAFFFGVFWPWVIYGIDVEDGRNVGLRVLATANGGWQLWVSWSVYQMNVAALFLAIGYFLIKDYVVWLRRVMRS